MLSVSWLVLPSPNERMVMTTMTDSPGGVIVGVDTHKDVHVAAVLDTRGGLVETGSFPATQTGYETLERWAAGFGPVTVVGVEGTGSWGAGLHHHLSSHGIPVIEVNRPNRQHRRRHGKSDTVDAIGAARAVISGEASTIPKTGDGPVEAIRLLRNTRRSAIKARTQTINQIRSVLRLISRDG